VLSGHAHRLNSALTIPTHAHISRIHAHTRTHTTHSEYARSAGSRSSMTTRASGSATAIRRAVSVPSAYEGEASPVI